MYKSRLCCVRLYETRRNSIKFTPFYSAGSLFRKGTSSLLCTALLYKQVAILVVAPDNIFFRFRTAVPLTSPPSRFAGYGAPDLGFFLRHCRYLDDFSTDRCRIRVCAGRIERHLLRNLFWRKRARRAVNSFRRPAWGTERVLRAHATSRHLPRLCLSRVWGSCAEESGEMHASIRL